MIVLFINLFIISIELHYHSTLTPMPSRGRNFYSLLIINLIINLEYRSRIPVGEYFFFYVSRYIVGTYYPYFISGHVSHYIIGTYYPYFNSGRFIFFSNFIILHLLFFFLRNILYPLSHINSKLFYFL